MIRTASLERLEDSLQINLVLDNSEHELPVVDHGEAEAEEEPGGWQLAGEFDSKTELESFLASYTHKMTSTHGGQSCLCSAPYNRHQTIAGSHRQLYGYLRCSSAKCSETPEDFCNFRFKVI